MIENIEAFQIFGLCSDQLIFAGMGEAVAINIQAVKTVMDVFKTKDKPEILLKVITISRTILGEQREEQKKKEQQKKPTGGR